MKRGFLLEIYNGRKCRPVAPGDVDQMRALHAALFPLDYEDAFYYAVARGLDSIFSWAAFLRRAPRGPAHCLRASSEPSFKLLGSWAPHVNPSLAGHLGCSGSDT